MKDCASKSRRKIAGTRITTLAVDDSPFVLKTMAQTLKQTGNFDLVGTATNGRQALRYVSMLSPELVLLDVHMPHFNGLEATRSIKHSKYPPAVIIITSDHSSLAEAAAERAGADAFISRDGNLRQQLIAALQKLFGPNNPRRGGSGRVASGRTKVFRKRTVACANVRPRSGELADAPSSAWLLHAVESSHNCALPHDSTREK